MITTVTSSHTIPIPDDISRQFGIQPGRSGNVFLLPDEKGIKQRAKTENPRLCLSAHQTNPPFQPTRVNV